MKDPLNQTAKAFLTIVRERVEESARAVAAATGSEALRSQPFAGKMLRSALAARLIQHGPAAANPRRIAGACSAVELVHTASLFHDDVIDEATLRRGCPSLWNSTTRKGAILVGDLLLCRAMQLVLSLDNPRWMESFMDKCREVCAAEAQQELRARGVRIAAEDCLRIARQKTGPLFAFTALVCGEDDEELSAALEEAGYCVGTAYQLGDDLLDEVADEEEAGKTLGTDAERNKYTLACGDGEGPEVLMNHVRELTRGAAECLAPWPDRQRAVMEFLQSDLQPVWSRLDTDLSLQVEGAC